LLRPLKICFASWGENEIFPILLPGSARLSNLFIGQSGVLPSCHL
jgi:hypothetical protein